MPAPLTNQAKFSGGIDWKKQLLEAGGVDLFKDSPFEAYAEKGPWPSWLIKIENVLEPEVRDRLAQEGLQILLPAPKLGLPLSTTNKPTQYRTVACSELPCMCQYFYGGFAENKHRVHTYHGGGSESDIRLQANGDSTLQSTALPGLDNFVLGVKSGLGAALKCRPASLGSYIVANCYDGPSKFIGPHHDKDAVFGTVTKTIQSYN